MQRRRIVARRRRRRTVETTVHDAAVVACPLDELGLDQRGRLEAGDRPACDLHPLPLRVVDDDLGRGAGAAADRGEAVALPAQRTVHALRDDLDLTGRDVSDAQAAEPTLVAVEGDAGAVGRPGERALARTPRRIAVLERLGDDRLCVEVGVERPEVQEAVDIGEEAGELPARGEPDLLRLGIESREGAEDLAARIGSARRDLARVPGHVGHPPLVPRDPLRVGGERGIEAEVGIARDADRPRAVVRKRRDSDVVAVDRRTRPWCHRARPRAPMPGPPAARRARSAEDRRRPEVSHRPPSTAAYTSALPSGIQSNAPPPYETDGRGAGCDVTTSSAPPVAGTTTS